VPGWCRNRARTRRCRGNVLVSAAHHVGSCQSSILEQTPFHIARHHSLRTPDPASLRPAILAIAGPPPASQQPELVFVGTDATRVGSLTLPLHEHRQGRRSSPSAPAGLPGRRSAAGTGPLPTACSTASATNSRDAGRIESVTYSGGAGTSGRITPPKMDPAEILRSDENSLLVAWASGTNTSPRRHSSTSAAVGSRSALTSWPIC
jgi:hypothetical protein